MRKIDLKAAQAFVNGKYLNQQNTYVVDKTMRLYGHLIAEVRNGGSLWISNAGWTTVTTKNRLNAILDHLNLPRIYQKDFTWYLNDKPFPSNTFVKVKG